MASLLLELDNVTNLPDGGPTKFEVRGSRSVDIGRDTYLDWTLPDPNRIVSGRHCEIRYRDGGYFLTDISTNGTYLNGADKRLTEPTRLKTGDVIDVGPYIIKVTVEEDDVAPRAEPATPRAAAVEVNLWDASGAAPPAPVAEGKRRSATPVRGDALDWHMDLPTMASEGPAAASWQPDPYGPGTAPDPYNAGDAPDPYGAGAAPDPYGVGPAAAPHGTNSPSDRDRDNGAADPYGDGSADRGGPALPKGSAVKATPPAADDPWATPAAELSGRETGWSAEAASGYGQLGSAAPRPEDWDAHAPDHGGDPGVWADGPQTPPHAKPTPPGGPSAARQRGEPASRHGEADRGQGAAAKGSASAGPPSAAETENISQDGPGALRADMRATVARGPDVAAPRPQAPQTGASGTPQAMGGRPFSVAGPPNARTDVPDMPRAPHAPFARATPSADTADRDAGARSATPLHEDERPTSATPPATSAEGADADYTAFLARLSAETGIPVETLRAQGPEAIAERLGSFMRLSVTGLHALLKARANARGFMRSGYGTTVEAIGNNPLKFLPTPEDVLRVLMGPPTRSYLGMEEALDQSFQDVAGHQVATYKAMQDAFQRIIDDLGPDAIERSQGEDDRGGRFGMISGGKKAKLWDTYKERWTARSEPYDNGMVDVFMMHFGEAYGRALRKTR